LDGAAVATAISEKDFYAVLLPLFITLGLRCQEPTAEYNGKVQADTPLRQGRDEYGD
jgi:hypothetical protein